MDAKEFVTSTHWGVYCVVVQDNKIVDVRPIRSDKHSSAIGKSIKDILNPHCRIEKPAVRQGYLEGESRKGCRGKDGFIEVDWNVALNLTAKALQETRDRYGNEAIYGGSYGWASAGRFHHAQSQIHAFLNLFGGYTRSVNDYSDAAAQVITPHILGMEFDELMLQLPTWEDVIQYRRDKKINPCGSCGEVVNLGKAALEFVHFREIPLHTSETPGRTGALTGELSLSVV